MSLGNLASMFSQRSGMSQSIAGSVIGSIMGYAMTSMMNRGIGSFLHHKDSGQMKSALTQVQQETANDPDHQLVQQVKQSTGIQDDNQARQYIKQAVSMLKEHTDNNPDAVHAAFTSHANSQGIDIGNLASSGPDTQSQKQNISDFLGNP